MAYRTIESDKDGRMIVYPSLYEPRCGGICKFLRTALKRLFSSHRK